MHFSEFWRRKQGGFTLIDVLGIRWILGQKKKGLVALRFSSDWSLKEQRSRLYKIKDCAGYACRSMRTNVPPEQDL